MGLRRGLTHLVVLLRLVVLAHCCAERHGVPGDVFLVKVGKSGSSTVAEFLRANGVECGMAHTRKVTRGDIRLSERFIISTRDPVERVLSAHKYSNPNGGGEPFLASRHKIGGRFYRMFYECFPNVTAFARAFIPMDGDQLVDHRHAPRSLEPPESHFPAADDSALERRRKCRWIADEAIEPRQGLMAKHVSKGFSYYLADVLPLLARKPVFIVRGGAFTAPDLLALGPWLNITLTSVAIPWFNSDYPRAAERLHDLTAYAALRKRLQFEYDFLAKLRETVRRPAVHPDRENLCAHGFVILRGVLTEEHVDRMASAVVRHLQLERHRWVERLTGPGWTLPNFMREEALAPLHALATYPPLLSALDRAAGGEGTFRYCGSDDVGIDRRVDWHRDLLPPHPWRFAHVRQPMWGPWDEGVNLTDGFGMVTVAIYLQDHSSNSDSLTVSRSTHLSSNCSSLRSNCRRGEALRPRKGDVVVFDRRLMHRGSKRRAPLSATNGSSPRGLVSLCFGRRNALTDAFERGGAAYQEELVTTRAPIQAFIRANAAADSARRREWDKAFDKYVSCIGSVPSESEQRALATALAARQVDAASAYGQRIVGNCMAKYLPPELRSPRLTTVRRR